MGVRIHAQTMAATAAAAAMDDDGDGVGTTTLFAAVAAVAAVIGWALALYCFIKKQALDGELKSKKTMLAARPGQPQPQVFTNKESNEKPVAQPLPDGETVAQPLPPEVTVDKNAPVAKPVTPARAAPVPPLMLRFAP